MGKNPLHSRLEPHQVAKPFAKRPDRIIDLMLSQPLRNLRPESGADHLGIFRTPDERQEIWSKSCMESDGLRETLRAAQRLSHVPSRMTRSSDFHLSTEQCRCMPNDAIVPYVVPLGGRFWESVSEVLRVYGTMTSLQFLRPQGASADCSERLPIGETLAIMFWIELRHLLMV